MGAVISWFDSSPPYAYRVLRFHTVESETMSSSVSTSDHPIEEGADITDHVRAEARTAAIVGRVSQKPTRGQSLTREGFVEGVYAPLRLDVPRPDPSFLQGGVASSIGRAVAGVQGPVTVSTLQFFTQQNFFEEVLKVLFKLQDDAQLVECVTTPWSLTNCIITGVTPSRAAEDGGGGTVAVDFKQIKKVRLKTANVPIASEPKMKKQINLGKQNPPDAVLVELKERSVLDVLLWG